MGCQSGRTSPPAPTETLDSFLSSPTPTFTALLSATFTPTITPLPTLLPSPSLDPFLFVVGDLIAEVWDDPGNEHQPGSLQTELILGEKVLLLEPRGEWAKIAAVEQPSSKDVRGYPGWVRSAALVRGWPDAARTAVVRKPRVSLLESPNGGSVMTLILDVRLPVESVSDEWVEVRLPRGEKGWLARGDVFLSGEPKPPFPGEDLFALAESLQGVHYKWGGATPDGFDCSGFTSRLFHVYGMTLPRDARDQAMGGEAAARYELQKGDLIFTSDFSGGPVTHVAFYWGDNMILDAAGGLGVTLRPLADLLARNSWVTARRYLP